jgi:glycosyltransferase involved in cell wall biosynthesis
MPPRRIVSAAVRCTAPRQNRLMTESIDPPRADGAASARVVLVHDYLLVARGAERVFAVMADMFKKAPILTLLYDERGTGGRFAGRTVTTSGLQRLGVSQDGFRTLLPLYPFAVERLHVPDCEVVLSSSSAFAHGVHKPAAAVHVCYCHAPFRYAWYEQERALGEVAAPLRPALRLALARMRRWDRTAAARVDSYIANSRLTAERIRRYYGRDSTIIHPPVETHRFAPRSPEEKLLLVSELVRHKRPAVALQAARLAGVPIRVAGSGPDFDSLRAAYPEAEFLGRVGDSELAELYASARAVIVPSMEEFGITAVEAQAAGRPVVAADAGGALETVIDGETGVFAHLDDARSFARAIERVQEIGFDPARAVANASRFSVRAFESALRGHVGAVLGMRRASGAAESR